jgi:hypothetical protein
VLLSIIPPDLDELAFGLRLVRFVQHFFFLCWFSPFVVCRRRLVFLAAVCFTVDFCSAGAVTQSSFLGCSKRARGFGSCSRCWFTVLSVRPLQILVRVLVCACPSSSWISGWAISGAGSACHGSGLVDLVFSRLTFITAICSGSPMFRLCVCLDFSCSQRREFRLLLLHTPRLSVGCDFSTSWSPARSPSRSDSLQQRRFRAPSPFRSSNFLVSLCAALIKKSFCYPSSHPVPCVLESIESFCLGLVLSVQEC